MNKMEDEILNSLELAEAQLKDDINFLHCIEQEFFVFNKPQENLEYLYWQTQAMLKTLTKSMEYNQKAMLESINKYYADIKKAGVN